MWLAQSRFTNAPAGCVRMRVDLRICGSVTALATPFTASGEIDLDGWRRLLQGQLDDGTQAISAIIFFTIAWPNELWFSATMTNEAGPPVTLRR